MAFIKRRELQRMRELEGPEFVENRMVEALEKKDLKPDDFSVRDLFEATVEDGRQVIDDWNPRQSRVTRLTEAVDTTAFKNISGQIVFTAMLEAYQSPVFLAPQLARTIPTKFNGEKIPGIGAIGDPTGSGTVNEGKEYPEAGVTEDWNETPSTTKKGLIVSVTKEAVFFDQTGQLLDRCRAVGEFLAIRKEKDVLDVVLGVTDRWNPQGNGALDTYSNSTGLHNFDNLVNSNTLTDWTDIDACLQAFDAITDPFTGEPIVIEPNAILCARSLAKTVEYVLNATQIEQNPNLAAANTNLIMYYQTPPEIKRLRPLTNAYVGSRMTAGSVNTTSYVIGDFLRAFAYMENWPITVTQQNESSDANFERDIVARFKASERGICTAMNPRYVVMGTGAS
jgi:hypothetical protein